MDTVCDAMDTTPAVDGVLSPETTAVAGAATVAAVASTATSTVGVVAAAAAATVAAGTADACLRVDGGASVMDPLVPTPAEPTPKAAFPTAAAWDAHLDNPPNVDPKANEMMQMAHRGALRLTTDKVQKFVDSVEFISLGCFCAVSNCLQLLGLKRNTYPFDWVRSSTEGIIHTLDMQFEDFLTYSTYNIKNQYVVFGGTRWGGSFWHHNLEVPLTKSDMERRISRFYGRGNVPARKPRFFVRVANSSREINASPRLREALCEALPEAEDVFLLTIVDVQSATGPLVISGTQGHGLLFYAFSEVETMQAMNAGADSFKRCSETYAKAVAFAVRYWAGEDTLEQVYTFPSVKQLCAACEQFDGGDPGTDLFTPRKFLGQSLGEFSLGGQMPNLLAKTRTQMCVLPQHVNPYLPFHFECFGKRLLIKLPAFACAGNILQVMLHGAVLTASVSTMWQGQLVPISSAEVEEQT